MANIERKRVDFYRKWHGTPLEDSGCYVSAEYKSFQRCFRNILKYIAEELSANLVWYHPNHYDESAMFERDGKYVYLSHSNYLYGYSRSTPTLKSILIRTAAHAEDYHGGSNNYANWAYLTNEIDRLLGGNGEVENIDNFPQRQWFGD